MWTHNVLFNPDEFEACVQVYLCASKHESNRASGQMRSLFDVPSIDSHREDLQ